MAALARINRGLRTDRDQLAQKYDNLKEKYTTLKTRYAEVAASSNPTSARKKVRRDDASIKREQSEGLPIDLSGSPVPREIP
jgi:phage shock protein A